MAVRRFVISCSRAERHRFRNVHQQVGFQNRLGLELLDEETVRSSEDRPVDVLQIITRDVLPVLAELDGEPLERTRVRTRKEPFDDEASLQIQTTDLSDDVRSQILFGTRHGVLFRVFVDFRYVDVLQQPPDAFHRIDGRCLCLEVGCDAMAQNRQRDLTDILG